jgi:putative ABC transport system permease protein
MLADLRHLSRSLRRSLATAAAAILTLSLTLGTGASIFVVVDAVLLTPPPFANPDALQTRLKERLGAPMS